MLINIRFNLTEELTNITSTKIGNDMDFDKICYMIVSNVI